MATAENVEASVTNSLYQDYTNLDNLPSPTSTDSSGFEPFTLIGNFFVKISTPVSLLECCGDPNFINQLLERDKVDDVGELGWISKFSEKYHKLIHFGNDSGKRRYANLRGT